MDPKTKAACPCNGCKDRCGDPNCHSELCPHGYLEWKRDADAKKAAMDEHKAKRDLTDGYVIDKMRAVTRRSRK